MSQSYSEDQHQTFISLLTRHEPVIRASIRAVIWQQEDIDEILQRVSIVAWQKFNTLIERDGFAVWACVIARYEILKFKRDKVRDRLFELDPDITEKIMIEGEQEVSLSSRRINQLDRCLEHLPQKRRELILTSYRSGCSIKSLAETLGKSQDGLYQLLKRIRLELKLCIDRQMNIEDGIT